MKDNQIKIKYSQEVVGVRTPKIKYFAEIMHHGLNDHKVLSAEDEDILENKVSTHIAKLSERWGKIVERENAIRHLIASQKEAELRTESAAFALQEMENILLQTLGIDDTVDWDTLKDHTDFSEPSPEEELRKKLDKMVHPPKPHELEFEPKFSIFDKLIRSRRIKKEELAQSNYLQAVENWSDKCTQITKLKEHHTVEMNQKLEAWNKRKADFIAKQEKKNKKVDILRDKYMSCDEISVIEYCELVLSNSQYPDSFPKSFELDYNVETKILVIEYVLPSIEHLPTLKEVKYVKNKELKETHITEKQLLGMFDDVIYKIVLRTIHEIFEADVANAIEVVSLNGWINALNKATGKRENNCIVSIQAKKSEFLEIDLEHVDPKACFKSLKGVGSSKLSGITPIQPIMQISRADKRFVNHYEVAAGLDDSINLASMDWEDFEHLIREVFAMEFSSNGGEVKVTQASRDGGVDAIAFDPDPIRGGKIVIQAKRYTNTVGVSAVRDLYGTVMNEGATKGILVTTADYGPDAYDFAKGKPLTLLNGANLLYLLERHGHKAKIDIKEARKEMKGK